MVTGPKESLLEIKNQLKSVYPIKASIIGSGSSALKRASKSWRTRWGKTGIVYQYDPRHVDVLVEGLGLEIGNAVQTPIIDNMKDERESSHAKPKTRQ